MVLDAQGAVNYMNRSLKKRFVGDMHHWSDLKAFLVERGGGRPSVDPELGEKIGRIDHFRKTGEPGETHEEQVSFCAGNGGRSGMTIRLTLLEERDCLFVFEDTQEGAFPAGRTREQTKDPDVEKKLRKMIHDANNLLGAVTGYAELALGDLPVKEDPGRHCICQILRGISRVGELMKQIDALVSTRDT